MHLNALVLRLSQMFVPQASTLCAPKAAVTPHGIHSFFHSCGWFVMLRA